VTDVNAVKAQLRQQRIETPSWGYGNSGTRFKVFTQEGVARSPQEKVDDAAVVHRFTGVAPTVALHIPWDRVDDFADLASYAGDQGVALGTINSNVFQDSDYKLGSVTNPDPGVRRKATDHLLECIDVMDRTGSKDLKLWFSDGTNYPGQDSIRDRQDGSQPRSPRCTRGLVTSSAWCWSTSCSSRPSTTRTSRLGDVVRALRGARAEGAGRHRHRSPCSRHQHRVHRRVPAARRPARAFDFNSRFYADDDLMVGSADPFQLFRIMHELAQGGGLDAESGITFMLDQCHNIEAKIPAVIRSVMNVQEATAKALLVDTAALSSAQREGDVLSANAVLMDAYNTDVRPLLAELREEMGIDPDPVGAYHRSGYFERIRTERATGQQAGWGA
jgi:L-rhamnose isomerase/sugar isomerase